MAGVATAATALCPSPPTQWATSCGGGGGGSPAAAAAAAEEAAAFGSWSGLLPSAASHGDEHRSVYVKSRSAGNQYFFEDVRGGLLDAMQALRVEMLVDPGAGQALGSAAAGGGAAAGDEGALAGAHKLLLQGLHAAKGFLGHREQHRALALFEVCADFADHLGNSGRPGRELFFVLLARMSLGDAFAQFHKYTEAMEVLEEAVRLLARQDEEAAKTGGGPAAVPGPGERVLEGACCTVLCRVQLDLAERAHGTGDEAGRQAYIEGAAANAGRAVDLLERHLPEVPGHAAGRRDAAASLATALECRGVCDVRAGRYDECYGWFAKAQEALKEFALPGASEERLLEQVTEQLEHARHLHKFSGSGGGEQPPPPPPPP